MTRLADVMKELESKGSAQTRKILARHGAGENLFGVKVADLKIIAKKLKGEQALALELYATGNGDAQYLAGMVADGRKMSKKELETWAKTAEWGMVSEYTVPWVATESEHARALATKWITSKNVPLACSGWCTWAGIVAVTPDDDLDLAEIRGLLERVEKGISKAPNRVKYVMNGFVIAVGAYVAPLSDEARAAAERIGKVEVDMGDTACKVPPAVGMIDKIAKMGRVGKKRKTIRC